MLYNEKMSNRPKPTIDRDDHDADRATDEGLPEPRQPRANPAHDMGALEQVDELKVKRDPNWSRHIISEQLSRWWRTR